MKCVNCDSDGFYIYQLTLTKQMVYCHKHLPSFLEKAKKAGLLQTTEALQTVIEEGLKNLGGVVEEPVVEEVVEAPKPKKKTTKKAAPKNADNS